MTDEYRAPITAADIAVGEDGPEIVEEVTRVDIAKYAGASGDFNRIHVDEAFAKEAGNPSVFAHGMLTMGYASHMLGDWFGLDAIERFRSRFTAQVWPGDTVTVSGEVTEKSLDGGEALVEVEFTAENQDGDTILSGDATARVPIAGE